MIGSTERTFTINGASTNYVGATIVVLDADFHVTWAWDAFDHLDHNRGPILGEVLRAGDLDQIAASTPPSGLPAVDWPHNNAVSWSPAGGQLVRSGLFTTSAAAYDLPRAVLGVSGSELTPLRHLGGAI